MTRHALRAVAAGVLLLAATLTGGIGGGAAPAGAASYPSACPSMTDSITRLYNAFFQRDPEAEGFDYWTTQYRTGAMSMEQIAAAFVESSEFSTQRQQSNRSFVEWLYQDVVGPAVPPIRADEWVATLDAGYPRGAAVLSFTESREFVEKTSTARPLAGYLRWYPAGTHWYCGRGSTTTAVIPLTDAEQWADYYFQNRGQIDDAVGLATHLPLGRRHVSMVDQSLQPGFTDYNWNGEFTGDGDYGTHIEVRAGPTTDWIVVFSPRSIGAERLGWEIM